MLLLCIQFVHMQSFARDLHIKLYLYILTDHTSCCISMLVLATPIYFNLKSRSSCQDFPICMLLSYNQELPSLVNTFKTL